VTESSVTPTLREVTQDLTIEVRKMRRVMRIQNALIAGAVILLTVAIVSIGYVTWQNHLTNAELQQVTARNQAEIAANNRKLCPVLGAFITGPPSSPPTPRSEWLRDAFGALFMDWCAPSDLESIPDVPTPSPSTGQD
jgi:hypothetical protein